MFDRKFSLEKQPTDCCWRFYYNFLTCEAYVNEETLNSVKITRIVCFRAGSGDDVSGEGASQSLHQSRRVQEQGTWMAGEDFWRCERARKSYQQTSELTLLSCLFIIICCSYTNGIYPNIIRFVNINCFLCVTLFAKAIISLFKISTYVLNWCHNPLKSTQWWFFYPLKANYFLRALGRLLWCVVQETAITCRWIACIRRLHLRQRRRCYSFFFVQTNAEVRNV